MVNGAPQSVLRTANQLVATAASERNATSVTYVIPIWATLMGVLVLKEELSWYQPVGAAIVLLGVAISQMKGRAPS